MPRTQKNETQRLLERSRRLEKKGDLLGALQAARSAADHGPTGRCEACGDLHYEKYLYADRRADEHDGLGSRLCYECHTFIAEVRDDDYAAYCTEMRDEVRREQRRRR